MKRNILAILLVICVQLGVFGQNNSPIDLVLLLNISSDMSSSYENVSNYITGPFLSEYLRIGDTFHLITFSASTKLDSARRISGIGDVETIIGRMFIQYPVENGSDMAAAISYTERYLTSLPLRQKKIVIVSTGSSETDNLVNAAKQRLSRANTTLDFVQVTPGQPLTKLPASGRPGAGTASAPSSSTGTASQGTAPQVTQAPPPAGGAASAAVSPASGTPSTTSSTPSSTGTALQVTPAASSQASGAASQAASTVAGTASTAPATVSPVATASTASAVSPAGETTASVSSSPQASSAVSQSAGTTAPDFSVSPQKTDSANQIDAVKNTPSVSPARAESSSGRQSTDTFQTEQRAAKTGSFSFSLPVIAGIIVILLLILGIIIFFASRRLGSSPSRVMAEVSASRDNREERFADRSKDLAKYAAVQPRQRTSPYSDRPVKSESVNQLTISPTGPLLLNMFVEDQNTAIGKRNIHSLKSGYSLTVGGGKSDFLIFLVPIPANIGELRRSGSQLTFIPRKPKFFPDLGSSELRDCLNKTVRVVSEKGYELRFRFEMYEDPLVTLNRVLLQIKVSG